MSMDSDAYLFYGFHIKEEDLPWDREDTEGVWEWKEEHQGDDDAWDIDSHGFHSRPLWFASAVKHWAYLHHARKIEDLKPPAGAEVQLRSLCAKLGIQYEDQDVGWWLASYWSP